MAVLSLTKEELEEKGDVNDKKKSTLEAKMIVKLNQLWTTMANDWAVIYAQNGVSINAESYRDDLESILKETYRGSINYFKEDFKRSIEFSLAQAETEEDRERYEFLLLLRDNIAPALILWANEYMRTTASEQATFILDTTNNVINKRVSSTIQDSLEAGTVLSNQEVAKKTRIPLMTENKNRSAQIAEHEVGTSAGDAILQEGSLMDDELQRTPLAGSFFLSKSWQIVGIGTRPAHVVAAGQTRRIKEPFVVMGQLLQKPRDYSLGATAPNVAGCRCWIVIQ